LVNQTELDELLELFSIADILVSNDCGLAHLAMLTPIKEFVIFGPESPQVFGPLTENNYTIYSRWPCSPCLSVLNHRNSACKNNQCLKCIKPEDVYNFILSNTKLGKPKER
jgi:ADP-heptose:LPS heptosyltransferase